MLQKELTVANKDDILPLRQLAHSLPGSPSYWTLLRWTKDGATSKTGKVIYLKTKQLPSGIGSSRAMYDSFIRNLNN